MHTMPRAMPPMHAPAIQMPDIRITIFGYPSPQSGQTVLDERLVTRDELLGGRFEAELDARARENGWKVTHLVRRTPEDVVEYEDKLQHAVEVGLVKATGPARALLERFLTGEVTEDLVFALGRTAREGGGPAITEYAIKAAERDVYRVFWRVRLSPGSIHTLLHEAEMWAGMALDWIIA